MHTYPSRIRFNKYANLLQEERYVWIINILLVNRFYDNQDGFNNEIQNFAYTQEIVSIIFSLLFQTLPCFGVGEEDEGWKRKVKASISYATLYRKS